jgi:osmotically-inducible protein OsmY
MKPDSSQCDRAPHKAVPGSRRSCLAFLGALASLPVLQGCIPLAMTAASATAVMVSDRRTTGAYIEDEGLEWRASSALRERHGTRVQVTATAYNRIILLTGEAPDEATREAVGRLISRLDNVRGLVNEIRIGPPAPIGNRTNDTIVTGRVKARLVDESRLSAHLVKVVTSGGVVFLLGRLTQAEADVATEVARSTAGVLKVVRVFEYISDAEARRLDTQIGEGARNKPDGNNIGH